MDNCNNLLIECLEEALHANGYDESKFSKQLESKYGVSPCEISEKFETVHDALQALFGTKHYAVERSMIQALHQRQKMGQCSMDEEIQASAKVIDAFLEESERNLTASQAGLALLDFAKKMAKEVKDNKEQLRVAEWLAAIGQTAGMVGHDLRNPLQTIIGEVWLLRETLKKIPDNETKNSLQESISAIEEQASYMDKIVSDLQTFVKPIQVNKTTIRLKNLVRAVLAKNAMPPKIKTNILVSSNQTVNADQELLRRVLINLFNNAVQAMPNGGELTIAAKENVKQ